MYVRITRSRLRRKKSAAKDAGKKGQEEEAPAASAEKVVCHYEERIGDAREPEEKPVEAAAATVA